MLWNNNKLSKSTAKHKSILDCSHVLSMGLALGLVWKLQPSHALCWPTILPGHFQGFFAGLRSHKPGTRVHKPSPLCYTDLLTRGLASGATFYNMLLGDGTETVLLCGTLTLWNVLLPAIQEASMVKNTIFATSLLAHFKHCISLVLFIACC